MRNTLLPVAGFARIQWPWRTTLVATIALLLFARQAEAGMPSVSFTEVAALRMEVISFFLVVLFASAGIVQLIWNLLRRDFAWLPRLNYWRALGIVTLWGLLFVVVLTMISGARELMTPGAWEKNGATYKLKEEPKPAVIQTTTSDKEFLTRSFQILALANALQQHADQKGRWPTSYEAREAVAAGRWAVPGLAGTSYIYIAGPSTDARRIVVHEPQVFPGDALAITADGQLVQAPFAEILTRVRSERNAAIVGSSTSEPTATTEVAP